MKKFAEVLVNIISNWQRGGMDREELIENVERFLWDSERNLRNKFASRNLGIDIEERRGSGDPIEDDLGDLFMKLDLMLDRVRIMKMERNMSYAKDQKNKEEKGNRDQRSCEGSQEEETEEGIETN